MDGAGTDSCCTETENVFEESSLQDLEECGGDAGRTVGVPPPRRSSETTAADVLGD